MSRGVKSPPPGTGDSSYPRFPHSAALLPRSQRNSHCRSRSTIGQSRSSQWSFDGPARTHDPWILQEVDAGGSSTVGLYEPLWYRQRPTYGLQVTFTLDVRRSRSNTSRVGPPDPHHTKTEKGRSRISECTGAIRARRKTPLQTTQEGSN